MNKTEITIQEDIAVDTVEQQTFELSVAELDLVGGGSYVLGLG